MSDFTNRNWLLREITWPIKSDGALHPAFDSQEALNFAASFGAARNQIPWAAEEIRDDRRHRGRRNYRSLRWLALKLNKNPRTIRRYCEMGLVPGAQRTPGKNGHWRVNSSEKVVAAVRASIMKFSRRRVLKNPTIDGARSEGQAINLAWDLHSAIERVDPDQAAGLTPRSPKDSKQLIDLEISYLERKKLLKLATNRTFRTLLAIAAGQMKATQEKITACGLAKKIGVSRSTLYRRLNPTEIQLIISGS